MDVPAAVMEELKCSRCNGHLSRSPVYLQHDKAAVCGRCFAPERPSYTQYEATAKLLKFPCKTGPYVGQEEEIAHEATCQHRQYVCPLLGSARCDWLGLRTEILQHCQTEHPDKTCARCAAEVTVFRYRGKDGWRCERCSPARRACQNQSPACIHTDIDPKCSQHEDYFCNQRTRCAICGAGVSRGSLFAHYGSVHQDITHEAGSMWRASHTALWRDSLVSSVAGTAVCEYWLLKSQCDLRVHIPVSSDHLREFRCQVRVSDPATGHARIFTPPTEYDQHYDWRVEVKKEEFPSCSTELDVCVDIWKADL